MPISPRVFISYSHDSTEHKKRVLQLSDDLRASGVDCNLDQYEPFPEDGWPRWMNNQIEHANFVLVICTETYNRRATGQESPGRGFGASWETQLITQQIYNDRGRNSKFIPVTFTESDVISVPRFLGSSSHFCVETPEGKEELYRFLTSQPAVLKPPLGPVQQLSGHSGQTKISSAMEMKKPFLKIDEPVVIWWMPRGFILLDHLIKNSNISWATRASYYDYHGREGYGTHYHESYRWLDKNEAFENQFFKLQIPRGDWRFAIGSLNLMIDIREGRASISKNGTLKGSFSNNMLANEHAKIFTSGNIPLPIIPSEYRPLSVSGPIRDLAWEANDLLFTHRSPTKNKYLEDLAKCVGRIRRETRIEVYRKLAENHPACKNLEEIIIQYQPKNDVERITWLSEFLAAIWEAARCIEDQVS